MITVTKESDLSGVADNLEDRILLDIVCSTPLTASVGCALLFYAAVCQPSW